MICQRIEEYKKTEQFEIVFPSIWKFRTTSEVYKNLVQLETMRESPKVVALFSVTNFSNYIIELLQLNDTIQIKWNYAWIGQNIDIISHLKM